MKLPTWLIGMLIGILGSLLGVVFYAGQIVNTIEEQNRRLDNIETGVHQLWEEAIKK